MLMGRKIAGALCVGTRVLPSAPPRMAPFSTPYAITQPRTQL
jgi:hypothetical protein